MIKIPNEVLEAGARALHDACAHESMDVCRGFARAACLAMLEAWPGVKQRPFWDLMTNARHVEIILPQENSNDQ